MSEALAGLKRTHVCGALRSTDCGNEVVVMGWVQKRRDHGGLIFIDLRDRYGLVQIVFDPESGAQNFAKAEKVRNEYVLAVTGVVENRPEGTINPNLDTGEIEIRATELRILSASKTPPFYMNDDAEVDEMVRLKYRYLDLRRPVMQQNLVLRHKVTMAMRKFLDSKDFLEIETPMLAKSTPEGAREYLVPSRVHPGEFYVLPQSPQLFKQILMVSGMDKYFQIVRCFRDEDLRADRQPEFTQLDIEMSFVEEDTLQDIMEELVAYVFKETLGVDVPLPLPRLTYEVAMEKYGSDKPDLRFEIPLIDVADIVIDSDFQVFANIAQKGGRVKGINATGCARYSRKEIDELTKYVSVYGAKGLAWMQITEEGCKSSITKFFTEEKLNALCERMNGKPGDLLLFVADKAEIVADSLGHLRQEIAKREGLIDENEFNFSWVTEFPLLEYSEEEKRWTAKHHPFTSPMDEDVELMVTDPSKVRTKAYDMVLNGIELGGGSIRIHRRDVQTKIFDLLGFTREEAEERFGFLLTAFDYGVPPHGGIAFGLDRMIMLMAKRDSIRDVIAFPKTQSATCMMTQAPSPVDDKQLRDLHIRVNAAKKESPKAE
ncbi:MAG: aspartate--tRNA ligase [Clostridia bacterium]|nr:aspartate--tRNA ligase [Clostridia bacterium]